jgi:hypothetical protein
MLSLRVSSSSSIKGKCATNWRQCEDSFCGQVPAPACAHAVARGVPVAQFDRSPVDWAQCGPPRPSAGKIFVVSIGRVSVSKDETSLAIVVTLGDAATRAARTSAATARMATGSLRMVKLRARPSADRRGMSRTLSTCLPRLCEAYHTERVFRRGRVEGEARTRRASGMLRSPSPGGGGSTRNAVSVGVGCEL